jgi:octaprenyl-diphosphate synthase
VQSLVGFGRCLGRVYQIADDLLDFEQADRSGKRLGQDLCAGENTLPLLLACRRRADLGPRIRALRERDEIDGGEVKALLLEAEATGALEEARGLAMAEAERATQALEELPDTPYRTALAGLARFAAERHV